MCSKGSTVLALEKQKKTAILSQLPSQNGGALDERRSSQLLTQLLQLRKDLVWNDAGLNGIRTPLDLCYTDAVLYHST